MGAVRVINKFIASSWLIEKIVREVTERLPIKYRYGISYGPTFRYWLAFLRESERWTRERLEEYQLEQLRDLLIHAGKHVPFYRKTFAELGFRPEGLQDLSDIRTLPFIDRKTVKERNREFIADNIDQRHLIPTVTSGTTGEPLTVYGTKETEEKHWATVLSVWSRSGYHPGARTLIFQANITKGRRENVPWKRYGKVLVLSSNHFSAGWINEYVRMVNDFEPEYIVGFPHTLAVFSSSLRKGKMRLTFRPSGVIVYAEKLHEWQKALILDIMGTKVFSDYGMVEKVLHGGGCEHSDGFHLSPQYGLAEFIPLGPSSYEVAGTGLINYAMPLVRYRTGDISSGVGQGCMDCGRDFLVLPGLKGRVGDFLVSGDGEILSVNLTLEYKSFVHIERFQLYQDQPGKVELRIWPSRSFREEDSRSFTETVKRCLGGPVLNGIELETAILRDHGQRPLKFRMVDQQLDLRTFLST